MIFPASRRVLESCASQLMLLTLEVPITADCVEEGKICLHSELLSIAREVRNALMEDAQAVPYRTNVPEA